MEAFKPRTTKPEAGNKYYITKAKGGYSNAIQGKPTDKDCDVLANCVGYAYGRFNEIGGWGYCKYLSPCNAENFIQYSGGLEVGQTPKLGACMVWKKGATLSNSDGDGHVAIVEKVVNNTQVVTSESGYNCANPFWTKTRVKGDGNWGAGSGYTFLGFIYNPAPCCNNGATTNSGSTATSGNSATSTKKDPVCTVNVNQLSRGSSGDTVKAMQTLLISKGYSCGSLGADGDFGGSTYLAVYKFQADNNLSKDGVVGAMTWAKLLGM